GHQPPQIERQLAEMESPLYSYVPHQVLAKRNMVVMNKLGVNVMNKPTDQPGQRSWRVLEPTEPMSPFAEHVIEGYQELASPLRDDSPRLKPGASQRRVPRALRPSAGCCFEGLQSKLEDVFRGVVVPIQRAATGARMP